MSGMPNSNGEFIKKLKEIIEANLSNEQFGVSELAAEMGMNRTALYRKIKSKTGKSISAFIREFRLQKALEKLQKNEGNVSEIANEVGFGSSTYFNKCFHDYFGYPPGEVLKNESKLNGEKRVESKRSKGVLNNTRFVVFLFLSLITIMVLIILFIQNSSQKSIEKSIVVLPFINDTPPNNNDYLEGLREEIINKLSLIGEIKVISRTSSDTYRNSNKPIKTIAKELNVNYALEGSSQTINGKTRIRLQLIEAKTDDHLWSNPFEREVNDENIFEIQQEIAGLVSKKLKANITSEEKEM
ncbi:MAG: helix-turn-helix domain-containing protein, partial [Draconibacterium sp.]|nr:helix-turn-helix domain-containing protein [Draconibacterium sp.]